MPSADLLASDIDASLVHAAIAPASTLLADRRALYRLAADLLGADVEEAELPDDLLDSPLVRFRIGEALAGRRSFSRADLAPAVAAMEKEHEVRHGPARLRVLAGPRAEELWADALRAIAEPAGIQPPPRPLTEVDGERFRSALGIVADGLKLARQISPTLVDDLLAHVELLAILDPATTNGLVSASSRFFPGLVVIDLPATPLEVAEALVHEGAHEKFFDLATTHSFLGVGAEPTNPFQPSWSTARFPFEQAMAAWHAYTCLAQFALDAGVSTSARPTHAGSLLPVARERSAEIGSWLLANENYLLPDARWMLRSLLGATAVAPVEVPLATMPDGLYALDPRVRMARPGEAGRMLAAREGAPPELYWLDGDAADVLGLLTLDARSTEQLAAELAERWDTDRRAAELRLSPALDVLAHSLLTVRVPHR
jgi:hypothetical protein